MSNTTQSYHSILDEISVAISEVTGKEFNHIKNQIAGEVLFHLKNAKTISEIFGLVAVDYV